MIISKMNLFISSTHKEIVVIQRELFLNTHVICYSLKVTVIGQDDPHHIVQDQPSPMGSPSATTSKVLKLMVLIRASQETETL